MKRLLLYLRTLRWLKPRQVLARLRLRLYRPRPAIHAAPPARPAAVPGWSGCARAPTMRGPDRLDFLGVERRLASPDDWSRKDWPKLWLYNAHYFDDFVADDAASRSEWHQALLSRWIDENPVGKGTGWEPYPVSLRIANWVKWALGGNVLDQAALDSLSMQARWLEPRIEYHLLGNHLWANAKALVFAGAFFRGEEAERWLRCGVRLLEREIAEQVLPDGGHFERSPMYHSILLEDLLDLAQLAKRFPDAISNETRALWAGTAERMLRWAKAMAHPDGGPSFFNDAALGIAPTLPQIEAYALAVGIRAGKAPGQGVVMLPSSGYVRMAMGTAVLLADVAPIGPDYLPGHAHADTLSFELSLCGRRVLVNGGTSTYDTGSERQRQRGTPAHNTVVVDGCDSSEVWASFRVARRAKVFDVEVGSADNARLTLAATHDGYRRLDGRVLHRRCWELAPHELVVTDRLDGKFSSAEARYHFAPGETLEWTVDGGNARIESSTWHPRFGSSVGIEALVVRLTEPTCRVRFRIP